jgi:hypothetical protein
MVKSGLLTVNLQLLDRSFQLWVLSGVRLMTLPSHTRGRCGAKHFLPNTAQVVISFADGSASERRHAGDRDALW